MSDETNPQNKPKRDITQVWAVQGYIVRPERYFVPPTDIIELDDRVVVLIELAGVRGDSFRIALDNQQLMVSGTRERPDLPALAYHQAEIGFGEFRVSIPLPWSIENDRVSANYRNGLLQISLPRQQARQVHIVDVHTDEE